MAGRTPNSLTIGMMNLYFRRSGDTKWWDIGSLRDSAFSYGTELREHRSPLNNSTVLVRDKVVVISKTASLRGTAEALNVQNMRMLMGGATYTGAVAITGTTNVTGGYLALGEPTPVENLEVIGIHAFPDGYYFNIHFWVVNAAGAFDLPFNSNDWVGYPMELRALYDPNHTATPFGYMTISNIPDINTSTDLF